MKVHSLSDSFKGDINEPSLSHADLTSISCTATEEDDINIVTLASSSSLVAKKNTKLKVWCHFGLKQVDGRIVEADKSVCRECFM